eukprot:gene27829-36648_t
MIHVIFILILSTIYQTQPIKSLSTRKLSITPKEVFLESLSLENKVSRTKNVIERNLKNLITSPLNSIANSNFSMSKCHYGNSKWKVIYAPHITLLSKFLFTSFSVFYKFDENNIIVSNVQYSSKFFGSGWLNTKGNVCIINGTFCDLEWQQIWWDWCTDNASNVEETDKHIFPSIIQSLGLAAFIKSASIFPVEYIDDDLCVFEFPLTGTKICAQKM